MALQVSYTVRGVTVPNAYVTLCRPTVDKRHKFVHLEFAVYASKAAYDNGDQAIDTVLFNAREDFSSVDWVVIGTWAWAYNQLKTLPEFADAVDV